MKQAVTGQSDRPHRSPASALIPSQSFTTTSIACTDNRPEAIAQRKLADAIYHSPFMVAQRQQLRDLFGEAAQLQAGPEDEELVQGKFASTQRQTGPEEEELLQGQFASVQGKETAAQLEPDPVPRKNNTGLPDNLKAGIESLSGLSMDHVKVHYNSSQPAQLNALAYAQGHDIHVAPGQEQHLPHEAWHVVQQAQGRVQPTMQMKDGVPVNDDAGLEREADVMGVKALQIRRSENVALNRPGHGNGQGNTRFQLQKARGWYRLSHDAHLRNDPEHDVIGKPSKGESVTVIDKGARQSRFKIVLIAKEHSWVNYKDQTGWVVDSKLQGPLEHEDLYSGSIVSSHQMPIKVDPDGAVPKASPSPPMVSDSPGTIATESSNPLSRLGAYFNPAVAPVKDKNKMGFLGGNMAMENLQRDVDPSAWIVQAHEGRLYNRWRKPITGGGAWVLGSDRILKGSQASDQSEGIGKFENKDMDSHEMAGALSALWAGEMKVKDGQVLSINNQSGTFHFEAEANLNILTYLLQNNVIRQNDIDERTLKIMAWTQTGPDREGKLKPWAGFRGRGPQTSREGNTITPTSSSSTDTSSRLGLTFDFEEGSL